MYWKLQTCHPMIFMAHGSYRIPLPCPWPWPQGPGTAAGLPTSCRRGRRSQAAAAGHARRARQRGQLRRCCGAVGSGALRAHRDAPADHQGTGCGSQSHQDWIQWQWPPLGIGVMYGEIHEIWRDEGLEHCSEFFWGFLYEDCEWSLFSKKWNPSLEENHG